MKKVYGLLVFLLLFSVLEAQTLYDYPDQIHYSYFPTGANDTISSSYSSNGAWFGIGLPELENPYRWGKIAGPYSTYTNEWVGKSLLQFNFGIAGYGKIQFESAKEHKIIQYPGLLYQKYTFDTFFLEEKVLFISGRTCLINVDAVNSSQKAIPMSIMIKGVAFDEVGEAESLADGWMYKIDGKDDVFWLVRFRLDKDINFSYNTDNFEFSYKEPEVVLPGDTLSMILTMSQYFKGDTKQDVMIVSDALNSPEMYFERNEKFWRFLISNIIQDDKDLQALSVKAIQTLFLNLRSSIPSFQNYFFVERTGLDNVYVNTEESWFYASSLIRYDSKLSTNVLASNMSGLNNNSTLNRVIPVLDSTIIDNELNFKPMAAWTAWNIFSVNPDADLMERIYPFLKSYHEAWYINHNINNNLWCEDKNGVERADLNALLYSEKYFLMKIAEKLGYDEDVKLYKQKMDTIKLSYTKCFFDVDLMSFINYNLKDGSKEVASEAIAYSLWSGLAAFNVAEYYLEIIQQQIDNGTFESTFETGVFDIAYYYFLISGLRLYKYDDESVAINKLLLKQVLKDSKDKPLPSYRSDGMVNDNSSLTSAVLLLLINY